MVLQVISLCIKGTFQKKQKEQEIRTVQAKKDANKEK